MIEITIINILGVSVISNLIAHWFEPIQEAKRRFIGLFRFSAILFSVIHKTLNCSKCLSLWTGVLLFQDILAAALCSLVGFLINHLIDRIESWYD